MRLFMSCALVLACGPVATHQSPQRAARDAFAGGPEDIATLLHGSVFNGGLWFEDLACANQFPAPEEIHTDRFVAFAHCLAGLHLHRSKRGDTLPDVAVFDYGPGFEVEALVLDRESGPVLAFIGFASRTGVSPELPTISGTALEALRVSGKLDDVPAHAEALPTGRHSSAWLKLCLDGTGAITAVQPRDASTLAAARAFTEMARSWQFRPFTLQGQPIAVCAMIQPTYPTFEHREALPLPPPSSAPDSMTVDLASTRIAGATALGPSPDERAALHDAGISRLVAAFRYCIDDRGHVASVDLIRSSGLSAYDKSLDAGIRRWEFRPYIDDGHAVPVCSSVHFVYTQSAWSGVPWR